MIDNLVDSGYLPHFVLRRGIRRQLAQRINAIATTDLATAYETKMKYVDLLRTRPIAVETGKANEQHYEVGTDVLQAMLGPRMKYSACLYPKGRETLGEVSRVPLRCGGRCVASKQVQHANVSTLRPKWQCYNPTLRRPS